MLTDILVYKILSHVSLTVGAAVLNASRASEPDQTHWGLRWENNEVRACLLSPASLHLRACVGGALLISLLYVVDLPRGRAGEAWSLA